MSLRHGCKVAIGFGVRPARNFSHIGGTVSTLSPKVIKYKHGCKVPSQEHTVHTSTTHFAGERRDLGATAGPIAGGYSAHNVHSTH